MIDDDETVDPTSPRQRRRRDANPRTPVVEIAAHPDISRIGENAFLGPALSGGEDCIIGRHTHFGAPDAARGARLGVRSISRGQIAIGWSPRAQRFRCRRVGRRSVLVLDADGRPQTDWHAIAPGSYVRIEDSLLLHLAARRTTRADRLGFLGESEAAWRLRDDITRIASWPDAVLITGETGAGKEHVARALHAASGRTGRFVAVNARVLDAGLGRSKLFGHIKGAFTGAGDSRDGLMKAAAGGTLFIDEIADLTADMQAVLLRVLEERVYRPEGAIELASLEARVVTATNKSLSTLRPDLLARLSAFRIEVPPLRERRVDIPRLFAQFWAQVATERPTVPRAPNLPLWTWWSMLRSTWPENVRGLRAHARRVASLAEAGVEPCWSALAGELEMDSQADALHLMARVDFERGALADLLNVPNTTVDRRLRALGLRPPSSISDDEVRACIEQVGFEEQCVAFALGVTSARTLGRCIAEASG